MIIAGLMSGTSADAIDAALVRCGQGKPELLHFTSLPMPTELREPVLRLASPGLNEIDCMGSLDRALGKAFAQAVIECASSAGIPITDIDAIGSHGQTIRHRPRHSIGAEPFTLQIGCPATITEVTGITTVANFRRRDLAAGGEGAPLVPFAHQHMFADHTQTRAVLNIGGIANMTCLSPSLPVTGFDIGPGNMVMDGLMLSLSDGRHTFDKDGELAAQGIANKDLLATLMGMPFLQQSPPKSTGREDFGQAAVDRILAWPGLSDADRLATACAWTVQCIADSRRFLTTLPDTWLVCGGGSRNTEMMQQLAKALAPASVIPTEQVGFPSQTVEAISFAILAYQTLTGKSNTLASVTGASHDVCGGDITPGNNWTALVKKTFLR